VVAEGSDGAAVLSGIAAGVAGAGVVSPGTGVGTFAGGEVVSSARAANHEAGAARQQAKVKLVKTRDNRIMMLASENGECRNTRRLEPVKNPRWRS
jgi:hypothetical protein